MDQPRTAFFCPDRTRQKPVQYGPYVAHLEAVRLVPFCFGFVSFCFCSPKAWSRRILEWFCLLQFCTKCHLCALYGYSGCRPCLWELLATNWFCCKSLISLKLAHFCTGSIVFTSVSVFALLGIQLAYLGGL